MSMNPLQMSRTAVKRAAIALLTISINLIVDSVISRTSSLKGGRDV